MRVTIDKKKRAKIAALVADGLRKATGQDVAFRKSEGLNENEIAAELYLETPVGRIWASPHVDQSFAGVYCRVGGDLAVGESMSAEQVDLCRAMGGNTYSGKCNWLTMPDRKVTTTDAEVIAAQMIHHVHKLIRYANETAKAKESAIPQ